MSEPFEFTNRGSLRSVPGLGLCIVAPPRKAVDELLTKTYMSSKSPDAYGFVNALVSHTLISPRRLSYAEVATLPADARGVMRMMCAEAAGVARCAAAASDESLLAAMAARRRALSAAAPPAPGGLLGFLRSVGDTMDQWNVKLHHCIRGEDPIKVVEAFSESLHESLEDLQREFDEVRRQPLFFVVRDLPVSTVRDLLFTRPQHIEALVYGRVIADDALLRDVEDALATAPHVEDPQRTDLQRGLAALRTGDPYACRHLIPGVEGALWLTAEAEGVIDDQRRMLHTGKPTPPTALSISWLLSERGGMRVGKDYKWFLLHSVFDAAGQDIRHGRARSSHQTSSVWSFIALLGWLDRFADASFMQTVSGSLLVATTEIPSR